MSSHPNINNSFREVWQKLDNKFSDVKDDLIEDYFNDEPNRLKYFSVELDGFYVDFSKNKCDQTTLELLLSLAKTTDINSAIEKLFAGNIVNQSENRPALHTALRGTATDYTTDDTVVTKLITDELKRINQFIQKLHAGKLKGHSGKSIDTFVNIGIGGSDLGPRLAHNALKPYFNKKIKIYFVSNIDAKDISNVLEKVDPETTLFCVSSKSFSTIETLTNASTAKQWLISNSCSDPSSHFVAVTARKSRAESFGIPSDNCFQIWEWIGGRYSIWSAIGLPIAASIGMNNFQNLLAGACKMDEHFISSPLEKNIPVLLAMLDIWYINFYKTATHAIIPYDQSLELLPDYLAQLFMESNGKSVTQTGEKIDYPTSPVIWGGVGTNAQHAFFQLLHQGTRFVPADFIVTLNSDIPDKNHQDILMANCFAQTQALMSGNKQNPIAFKRVSGNKPSTTIVCQKLDPFTLGLLLSMYEHRVFVQGHVWNINSFDQWGVELGKNLASKVHAAINNDKSDSALDDSTRDLISRYKKTRN